MKKLVVIAALALGCITNITNSLFRDRDYDRPGLVRGTGEVAVDTAAGATDAALTVGTLGGWRHRDKYYRGPRDGNWSDRRNYRRGYVRTDAYPSNNREYYASDGYTRY